MSYTKEPFIGPPAPFCQHGHRRKAATTYWITCRKRKRAHTYPICKICRAGAARLRYRRIVDVRQTGLDPGHAGPPA